VSLEPKNETRIRRSTTDYLRRSAYLFADKQSFTASLVLTFHRRHFRDDGCGIGAVPNSIDNRPPLPHQLMEPARENGIARLNRPLGSRDVGSLRNASQLQPEMTVE